MSDIDEFLRGLASEGRQDSEGAFTVDLALATGKLAKFQLRDPRGYLLAVVAAACSGGARRLVVDVRPDGCTLDLLGVPLPEPDELKHLFTLLGSSVSAPETLWLRYLARAMLAAAGGKPAVVGLAAWEQDGKVRSSLKLAGTDLQSSKAPRLRSVGEAGVRFQVQEHVSGSVLHRFVQGNFSAVLGWGGAHWGTTCALMLHGLTYPIDPDSLGIQEGCQNRDRSRHRFSALPRHYNRRRGPRAITTRAAVCILYGP